MKYEELHRRYMALGQQVKELRAELETLSDIKRPHASDWRRLGYLEHQVCGLEQEQRALHDALARLLDEKGTIQ